MKKATMKSTAMKSASKKVAKSAMKAKAMKAMKAAKTSGMRKAMKTKVSKVAKGKLAKSLVFRGTKARTSGGLKSGDLMRTEGGRIVSKKAHQHGLKVYKANGLGKWTKAVMAARKSLNIKGFQVIGGKSAKGSALYAKAKQLYSTMK